MPPWYCDVNYPKHNDSNRIYHFPVRLIYNSTQPTKGTNANNEIVLFKPIAHFVKNELTEIEQNQLRSPRQPLLGAASRQVQTHLIQRVSEFALIPQDFVSGMIQTGLFGL